ncbi:hypothetical protein CW304_13465 [Bacillus sp. UFRGS-B20]|nr:hypothetical protein CW304_13465 [Bacillus sp. UFRGS-B20]
MTQTCPRRFGAPDNVTLYLFVTTSRTSSCSPNHSFAFDIGGINNRNGSFFIIGIRLGRLIPPSLDGCHHYPDIGRFV